jgi:type IV secretion system protein VirB11
MRMMQLYKLNNVPSMRDEDILRELNEVIDIIVQLKKTAQSQRLTWVYFKLASAQQLFKHFETSASRVFHRLISCV